MHASLGLLNLSACSTLEPCMNYYIADCENAASIALLERLGMRREGHFIQNIWFKGKWGDEYLYAILEEEWKPNAYHTPTSSL